MNIRRVYIKRSGGEIASEACYCAWRGFTHLNYPIDFFEWDDIRRRCLPLAPDTLVVGGATSVIGALEQIEIVPPAPLNIPDALHSFARRRIWQTTLGEVRDSFRSNPSGPVFIKPLTQTKAFPGFVIGPCKTLSSLNHLADAFQILAAEPMDFITEWRYFVFNESVVAVAHYRGDWSIVPESVVINHAVSAYTDSPAAYALDFGVNTQGDTILVEANDAFALGPHGIDSVAYAKMLAIRWLEIVESPLKKTRFI